MHDPEALVTITLSILVEVLGENLPRAEGIETLELGHRRSEI